MAFSPIPTAPFSLSPDHPPAERLDVISILIATGSAVALAISPYEQLTAEL